MGTARPAHTVGKNGDGRELDVRDNEADALASLVQRVRKLLLGQSPDPRAGDDPAPLPAPAVARALFVRDMLHATSKRLERLAEDARPVRVSPTTAAPVAGYYRWRPDDLLAAVTAEAVHLARVREQLASRADVPADVRGNLEAIAAQLLTEAVVEGERATGVEPAVGNK